MEDNPIFDFWKGETENRFFLTDEEKKNLFIAKKYIKNSKPAPSHITDLLDLHYRDLLTKYPSRK